MTKILLISVLLSCGAGAPTRRPAIEPAIARALGEHFGAQPVVTCSWIATIAVGCRATFRDNTSLVIAIEGDQWRVVGHAVAAAPIAAYVRTELAELGRDDRVDCGLVAQIGERLSCTLGGGGIAFVDLAGPQMTIELELDPSVAKIRAEVPRDADLERMSHALDISAEDE